MCKVAVVEIKNLSVIFELREKKKIQNILDKVLKVPFNTIFSSKS